MACDPNHMKQQNLSLIREVFLKVKSATKPQLAQYSGLSVVTVNSLVKELLARNEVVEDTLTPSTGGRPALLYRYQAESLMALVIYMYVHNGTEHLFLEVQDLFQQVIAHQTYRLREIQKEHLMNDIHDCMSRYPRIKVIVFGIPGAVSHGKIINMDYEFLAMQELYDTLKETYDLPVLVENDVNAALLGYCELLKQRDTCIAGLFFPQHYPPGCAIYLHGDIYHGANGMAGEVDQMPLPIHWSDAVSMDEEIQRIELLVRSLICMYDPHQLVIYAQFMDDKRLREMQALLQEHLSYPRLPQILIRTLHEDLSQGVTQLAKRALHAQIIKESE